MSLSAFIRDHKEKIIVEFAVFAQTVMPAGAKMSEAELRDHAEDILAAVIRDMRTAQSGEEQSRKSKGDGFAHEMAASGRLHADDRIQHGFTLRSVLAEFRALRATVLRLYEESGASNLLEVCRFNEAVDEALTESVQRCRRTCFAISLSASSATICALRWERSLLVRLSLPSPRTIRSGEGESSPVF